MRKLAIAAAALSLFGTKAQALNVQLFRPNAESNALVVTQTAGTLEEKQWAFSLITNWVDDPIEFGNVTNNSKIDEIVRWALTSDVNLSYGFSDRIGFGVSLPLHLTSTIEPFGAFASDQSFSVGDMLFRLPIRLNSPSNEKFGFALIPFVTAPTGKVSQFLGDENVTGGADLVFSGNVQSNDLVSFNLGYKAREKETINNLEVGHELIYRLGYLHRFGDRRMVDGFIELYGSLPFQDISKVNSPIEAIAGLRKRWNVVSLLAGGGFGLSHGYGAPQARVFAGLGFQKPNQAEEPPPEPTPEPEPVAVIPAEFAIQVSVKDQNQKAIQAKIDVLDTNNKIIETELAETRSFVLSVGSYRVLATKPGYFNASQNIKVNTEDEKIELVLRRKEVDLSGEINFDSNKATIKPASIAVLTGIVEKLKKYPEFTLIEIAAHTDSQGKDSYNLALSNKRSQSVREFFIDAGIDANRLIAKGYGETQPIADNTTAEGRRKNRRVVISVLERKE